MPVKVKGLPFIFLLYRYRPISLLPLGKRLPPFVFIAPLFEERSGQNYFSFSHPHGRKGRPLGKTCLQELSAGYRFVLN